MWRAFFLAVGICLLVMGVECLMIDNAVWADNTRDVAASSDYYRSAPAKVFRPKEWMPWTMLTCGAVIVLYASTIQTAPPPSE